jgi:acyl-CoA synthetase (AMP-forming)/AMP-acid ligase II
MSIFLAGSGSSPALYDSSAQRWFSYADLASAVENRARAFHAARKPLDKSLILSFCRNDFASVVTYLAAIEAGAAIALLPETLAAEFQTHLISIYQPEFLFNPADTTNYSELGGQLWKRNADSDSPAIHPGLSVLLSTSGTTGNPKFVRLSLDNIRANALSIAEALHIEPHHRAAANLPLHYSYGLSVINSHLARGASVVLTGESFVSPAFWNLMREQTCDSLAGVPYSYQMLDRLKLDGLNVPGIRTLTQAGGKLGSELIAKFHRTMTGRGGRFFTMYGQTEATARISVLPAELLPDKTGSVGFAIPGGSITIDEGEIVYSGPNVMLGYAESRADLALGDTHAGTLRTGDLGYLDGDGCLWVTGRLKREAKLFGLRVNLDDLEAMVRVHGPAAVVGRADRLSIFCEFEEALFPVCRDELASKLRVHARAFEFHRIDRLPINGAGKIDYSALGTSQ